MVLLRARLALISRGPSQNREISSSSLRFASAVSSKSTKSPSAFKTSATAAQFKTYKPVTPGLRHLRRPITEHLYPGPPIRALTVPLRKKGGRNNQGRITVRHRGGGHKRRLRDVDFMREEPGLQRVIRIEFDPGRSAHIALIKHSNPHSNKPLSYILACEGLKAGDAVQSLRHGIPDGLVPGFTDPLWSRRKGGAAQRKSLPLDGATIEKMTHIVKQSGLTNDAIPFPSASEPSPLPSFRDTFDEATASLSLGVLRATTIVPGNVLPVRLIPAGTQVHSIALRPDGKGQLVRSAGSFGVVVSHDDYDDGKRGAKYTQVRLQSGEVRNIPHKCVATIGRVSNPNWKDRSLGKAGRSRNLGRRPSVRGVAMNAYVVYSSPCHSPFQTDVFIPIAWITHTEEGVENQREISIPVQCGGGWRRGNGQEDLDLRETRW